MQRKPQSRHDINLWKLPLQLSIASVGIFALTLTMDMLAAYHYIHLPDWFSMGGIDDARAILGAMLGCVSTVLALIFSVALLVLSMVANLFGPRLLYRFVQDWVTQVCIGLFMGAFIYVFLVFLVTHKDDHSSFIPQVSLITSWFIVLGAFGFLVFYSHRVASLIQNPDAIGRIVDDLRSAAALDTHSGDKTPTDVAALPLASTAENNEVAIVNSATSGYLQEINRLSLVAAAAQANASVVVPFRPGQFVLEGETLAVISPASAYAALAPAVQATVIIGRHRVLKQDLEFGVAQIVEISIRALSPAINDTFTGIACVDFLGEALTILAGTPPGSGQWFDSKGVLRLSVRALKVPRLIKQAFDQIRQAAADNPAVLIRLLSTIERLASKLSTPEEQIALIEEAHAVWETATAGSFVSMDRRDLEGAWKGACAKLPKLNNT